MLPNVRIMEIDIDDVPWKADLVSQPPTIEDGHFLLPTGPGWGADINEAVLAEHAWQPRALAMASSTNVLLCPLFHEKI